MTKPPEHDTSQVFDATPYLKLFINKEGRWFQNNAEIIHPEIYLEFNRLLEKTEDGGYLVRMGHEICRVEVEDAPFVVLSVIEEKPGDLIMVLNDRHQEPFDPERFWIGQDNIPYSAVKEDRFHARFSRAAYYQLAKHIIPGEDDETFYFVKDDKRILVRKEPAHESLFSYEPLHTKSHDVH